jgi:hypothetical protein
MKKETLFLAEAYSKRTVFTTSPSFLEKFYHSFVMHMHTPKQKQLYSSPVAFITLMHTFAHFLSFEHTFQILE